ncbi:MAG TPA: MaoC family dehydratase [Firmicutes bacterium]|nr:MaoC family dehydratase [Bacillota bacterium]
MQMNFQVGDRASIRRTVTESDIVNFAGITGDFNPVHVDEEYAKDTVFGGRIAHGLFTASLISSVLGNKLPGPGCVYLKQTLTFLAPVRIGDTIEAEVEVLEIIEDKGRLRLSTTCKNQAGKTVLNGEAIVKI